jgi:hypothetical protein
MLKITVRFYRCTKTGSYIKVHQEPASASMPPVRLGELTLEWIS